MFLLTYCDRRLIVGRGLWTRRLGLALGCRVLLLLFQAEDLSMKQSKEMILRACKGAPLSVLVALFLFGPSGRRGLVARTGYSKDVVSDALMALESMDLIARINYRRWALLDNGKLFELSTGIPQIGNGDPERLENRLSASERLDSRLSALVDSSSNLLSRMDLIDVLHEFGIYGQKAQELSKLPHVLRGGREYIAAHVRAVADKDLALAIWRMSEGWAAPKEVKQLTLDDQIPDEYKDVVFR